MGQKTYYHQIKSFDEIRLYVKDLELELHLTAIKKAFNKVSVKSVEVSGKKEKPKLGEQASLF